MIEEMDFKEEDCSSHNFSFDDNYNNSGSEEYLFSKENIWNRNECFETEFKKVFNVKDIFGQFTKEEEKDVEPENNEDYSVDKKKIFKLIYNTNKYTNKKDNVKTKKFFNILGKNNFKNYTFDDLILYIRKLNNSTRTSSSISKKYKLLKLEKMLISELKTRILNQIKEN